ncbi:MAG: MFS transporter [Candidatus Competibacterales bacterium]|nr:MFS transporter [Candidatus Competibacterales bacterium]
MPAESASVSRPRRRAVFAWCLYDWANSAFPTVITTFVFAAYFTRTVAETTVAGTSQWGWTMSLVGLLVALSAPLLGAIADFGGRRKPWIAVFTVLCALASAALWWIRPDPAYVALALLLVLAASYAFELGMVFYNAMLPDLAPDDRVGRYSGWGWGLGYAGGLACLGLALAGFVRADAPWFGLSQENAEHLRAMGPLVAVWLLVFSLPLFLFTPDRPATGLAPTEALRRGVAQLLGTFHRIRDYADIARFLLARMLYTDGLNTLFAFGGIYAAGTFGMDFDELILFGIGMNVTAGLGAAAFAWMDDRAGPRPTILLALMALTGLGLVLLVIEDKTLFWLFGLPLGLFVGPAQSASRSLMAHLAPAHLRTEMFGLYALSGKATAFLGPALLALATDLFASQRAGMATILAFFVTGGLLLLTVPASRRKG